jgi:hypothetical protein
VETKQHPTMPMVELPPTRWSSTICGTVAAVRGSAWGPFVVHPRRPDHAEAPDHAHELAERRIATGEDDHQASDQDWK